MRSAIALLVVFSACVGADQVGVSSATGTGAGLGACDCSYDDGSHGSASIQITCFGGTGTMSDVSFFFDPSIPATDQSVLLIYGSTALQGQMNAGGTGRFEKLGVAKRASASKIVRALEGVEVTWDEQIACDAAYGCSVSEVLKAGSFKASGGCQDYWETIAQSIGN